MVQAGSKPNDLDYVRKLRTLRGGTHATDNTFPAFPCALFLFFLLVDFGGTNYVKRINYCVDNE